MNLDFRLRPRITEYICSLPRAQVDPRPSPVLVAEPWSASFSNTDCLSGSHRAFADRTRAAWSSNDLLCWSHQPVTVGTPIACSKQPCVFPDLLFTPYLERVRISAGQCVLMKCTISLQPIAREIETGRPSPFVDSALVGDNQPHAVSSSFN